MNKTYSSKVGEIKQIPKHIWNQLELHNGIVVPNKSKKYRYCVWTSAWDGNHRIDISVHRRRKDPPIGDGVCVAMYKPLLVSLETFLAIRDAI